MADETHITEIATPRTIIGVSEVPATPRKEVQLTTIQRQLIFNIFTQPAKSVAAFGRDVGLPVKNASQALKSIGCKLQPALDEHEITIDNIAVVIKDALVADRMTVDKDGGEHLYPDHTTRLRAAEMLAKLGDMYPAKKLEIDDNRKNRRNPLAGASMEALELMEGIMLEFSQNGKTLALPENATQN